MTITKKELSLDIELKPTDEQRILLDRHMEYYYRYYNRLCDKYRNTGGALEESLLYDDMRELGVLRKEYPQMAEVSGYVYISAIKHFHKDRAYGRARYRGVEYSAFDTEHASIRKKGLSIPMFRDGIAFRILSCSKDKRYTKEMLAAGACIDFEEVSIAWAGNKYVARVQCSVAYKTLTPQERKTNSNVKAEDITHKASVPIDDEYLQFV